MAKPAKKELKESTISAKDLSLEKRIELYQAEFNKFKDAMGDTYGLTLDVEIVYHPKGSVPRMVLVDLLKKDVQGQQKQ